MSNHIYVANELNQKITILATPNPDWELADVFADAVELIASTTLLCATLGTVGDAFTVKQMVRLGIQITAFTAQEIKIGVDATKYQNDLAKTISANGIPIASNNSAEVMKVITENPLKYLRPSAWAAILGGSDTHLSFFSNDGRFICDFNTNSDYSWIARESDVVRSKYGTIHTPDPDAGKHSWADMGDVVSMIVKVMNPKGDCKSRLHTIRTALSGDSKTIGYDAAWNAIVCETQGSENWGFSIHGSKLYAKSAWIDDRCYVLFTSKGSTGNKVNKDDFIQLMKNIPTTNQKCTDQAKAIMQKLRNEYPNNRWCVIVKKSPGGSDNWEYGAHYYHECIYKEWKDGYCHVAWCLG